MEAHAQAAGLNDDAAYAYAALAWWTEHYVPAPRIVSGRRSLERQMELQRQWDRGDRRGLKARPATNSAHVTGDAWDVESGPGLDVMAQFAPYAGVRWGGNFRDPDIVHFDMRG